MALTQNKISCQGCGCGAPFGCCLPYLFDADNLLHNPAAVPALVECNPTLPMHTQFMDVDNKPALAIKHPDFHWAPVMVPSTEYQDPHQPKKNWLKVVKFKSFSKALQSLDYFWKVLGSLHYFLRCSKVPKVLQSLNCFLKFSKVLIGF